jgi:hypothetical protein
MNRFVFLFFAAAYSAFAQKADNVNLDRQIQEIKLKLPQRGTDLSSRGIGIEFTGDFLYWISNQDSIWMATLEGPPAFLSGTNIFSDVRILNQKFKFDPGFRVAASYFWGQKDWETSLSWTRYRTKSHTAHGVSPNEVLISSWGFASRVNQFTILDIQQAWKLDYDVVDLNAISKNFNFMKFSFTPTLGVRGAFIRQNVFQQFNVADIPMAFVDAEGKMNAKSRFSGFGILGSTSLNYKIYGGFSLFGNLLGSLNYGRIKTVMDHTFFVNNGEALTGYTPRDKVYRVRANAEIQGGVAWSMAFADGRTALSLMLAYEQVCWFNINSFKKYFAEEGASSILQFAIVDLYGDLTLRGLTTRAGLEF